MQGQFLIIGSAVVLAIIIVIVVLHFVKKAEMKYYRNKVKNLEKRIECFPRCGKNVKFKGQRKENT